MLYETDQARGSAELAAYYLQNGKGTHAYRYFGVHRLVDRQGWCYVFRVSAPGADRVSLVGEWDGWEPWPMLRLESSGVWELYVSAEICPEGLRYKYLIQKGTDMHYKADPYARKSESGGEGASFICTESHYVWSDGAFLSERAQTYTEHTFYSYPMNVYEVELSGWLGASDIAYGGKKSANYREIADLLAQYAADMGYTHLLIHSPCRQGAGKYGLSTWFAPDASLGTPDDFAYFMDRMHKERIGVIMELECCALGTHAAGQMDFDGAGMYTAYRNGKACFDYDDPYATTLLYSAALFWLREFHLDGLYINTRDMVADRSSGNFVRELAHAVHKGVPGALLIIRGAGYRGLTAHSALGGLGYDLLLDFAAESALLDCFSMPASLRLGRMAWRDPAKQLYAESGILALSSEIAARRSVSVMESLHGSHSQKFDAMRLLLMYMTCLPGKKLLFMGNEIGQISAWSIEQGVEWFVQEFDSHKALRSYVKAINALYLHTPALWECDFTKDGLAKVHVENAPEGLIAFKRFNRAGGEVCAVLHFGEQDAKDIRVAVGGRYPYYTCVFSTKEQVQQMRLQTDGLGMLSLDLDGLSGVMLCPVEPAGGFWFENV